MGYFIHDEEDPTGTGNRVNVWTNSRWYYSYLTLRINHTHIYNTWVGGDYAEIRCGECGYRDHAFTTSISGNNIKIIGIKSSVALSGNLIIPASLNGKTVIEIGPSAFANQTGLTNITIPASVTSIGSYAFSGCNNVTITLQRASAPVSWPSSWNAGRPVVFTVPGGCGLSHVLRYEQDSYNYHKIICIICNDYILIKHNVRYEYISVIWHWKKCTACTLEHRENHLMINGAVICCPIEYLSAHQEH